MLTAIILTFWFAFVFPDAVPAPDPQRCDYGCIVAGEYTYRMTRNDLEWLARTVRAESGPRFVEAESSATAWAFVQGLVVTQRHRARHDRISLATYVQNYSAACSKRWATGGTRYSPRITPRADRCRARGWDDLPLTWRKFAIGFLDGDVSNESPGYYHVLARGFEEYAGEHLIGPYYATSETEHPGGNAYYRTQETKHWTALSVRVVPATKEISP